MKRITLLLISLLLLGGCSEAKLIDGKEAVVTFKESEEEGITAEELYSNLKEIYGTELLVNMIDTYLLDKEYKETSEEKDYINQVIKSVKEYTTTNNYDYLEYIKNSYNVSSEKGLKEYISLSYRRNKYTEDYTKTTVTDKQINEYYKDYTIGDIKASHILITANVSSTATEDEKTIAENAAKKKAEEIIKELDGGADFATLAKKYSEDSSNAENGGDLGYFNRGKMVEEFENAAIALEIGKYSAVPVKTTYGYHIIYKVDQKEKPSLEDSKETIIETISKELIEVSSSSLYLDAMDNLRSKYDMNITDTDLKNSYEDYVTKMKAQK